MPKPNGPRGILRLLRRFARDRRGLSAVEFAFVFPVMAALYLGGTALTEGIVIKRKVTLTTRTLGDLTSQYSCISDDQMNTIFMAAGAVLQPYPLGTTSFTISSLNIDKDGNATVEWSDKEVHGGTRETGRQTGQSITLPSGFWDESMTTATHLIMAEGTYNYNPVVGGNYTGPMALSETFYLRARRLSTTQQITRQTGTCSS